MDVDKPLSVAFLIALMVGGFILTANMHFGLAQTGTSISGIINMNTVWTKAGIAHTALLVQ